MLRLHNTLTGKLEEFEPIENGKVGMYNCGPTVYDYAHIGNFRSYVFADTLRRTLEYLGLKVNQVINVTDVGHLSGDGDEGEDKMTKALKREGKPMNTKAMREIAEYYFKAFKNDISKLNIELPGHFPFASDHIKEDVALVKTLLDKGYAYQTSDGIYFDTKKDTQYGKLGGLTDQSEDRARIETNPEKKNSRDFALWKFNSELGYEASIGKGFPGWHIECSAMSMKYLGETFDIHTGGIDHIPVHHNNEIAQSESATGKPLAHYWLHNGFVNIGEDKMAKSEGNFITLQTLIEKKINPIAYRYWLLQARYSTQVNFSWDALKSAETAFEKLVKQYQELPNGGVANEDYLAKFRSFMEDDLDTPKALALVWEVLKDDDLKPADKKATLLDMDKVLGFDLEHAKIAQTTLAIDKLPEDIQKLIEERENARKNKDFATSDKIRNKLKDEGYLIEDKPGGPEVSKAQKV
jgi:cysteinyl-tRNA synthetase